MLGATRVRSLSAVLLAGIALAGCSSGPQFGGGHRHYAVGRPHYTVAPYQVNGVWYYPKADYGYDESGTASWYGPGFDHRATADGEIYDMNDLTAAHKTLPLPSVVEVTNLQNGRELRLRVNDRGPFVGDRLIDVSRRAAQLLGFAQSGTAPVRVRILKDESIKVAEAAMQGEMGSVRVATGSASRGVELASAAPPRRHGYYRASPAPAPQPYAAPTPPELAGQQQVLPPTPEIEVAAAEPPPRMRAVAAPPPPLSPPASRAAPPRRFWPSLIAPAEAETLHPPIAVAARPPRGSSRIFVQAGAFAVPENARHVRARIAGLGSAEIVPVQVHGAAMYRVRLGPVASEVEARRLLSKVVDRGYPGARLVDR